MFNKISLPAPDTKLLAKVLEKLKYNDDFETNRLYHQQLFDHPVNVARCEYYSNFELKAYTDQLYKPYFDETIQPVIVKLVNVDNSQDGFYLPHVDKKRFISLNYYTDLGGNNVTTSFYNEIGAYDLSGNSCTYNDVTPYSNEIYEKDTWYCLDVNRYHSVENIKTTRIALALSFSTITMNDFYKKYSHLFYK